MKLENESVDNNILEDLARRNRNWGAIENKFEEGDQKQQESIKELARVERELQQHKSTVAGININQESKQTAEGRRVVSLPKTAGEGHGQFGLKGLTATNLIENGDFREGTSGWDSNGWVITPEGIKSNENAGRLYHRFNSNKNDNYYKVIYIDSVNSGSLSLGSDAELDLGYKELSGVGKFSWVSRSGYSSISFNNSRFQGTVRYVMAINLTQTFGAGNEPTKEECDRIFANYFEGTQSVNGNVRVSTDQSALYLNAPKLRSLPNGVADSIENGVLVKRVGETLISGNDGRYMTLNHRNDTVQFIYSAPVNIKNGLGQFVSSNLFESIVNRRWNTDMESITSMSDGRLAISISRNKLSSPDIKGFEKWTLENPLIIHYQLAEPEIIPLYPSGNLITQPSGTVYVEDVVADVATYSDKAEIGRTELLIKELDKLSVMDFETGDERDLDVSKAVISTDKLSFTHPDLTNGNIVFFEYYYLEESTDGLASVEYFDSRYTIKDSVTNKHYKWSIAIADGVPSIELEEV